MDYLTFALLSIVVIGAILLGIMYYADRKKAAKKAR